MWNANTARRVRRELENMFDRRISQVEMGNWLGYSRTAIQSWERGRKVPDPAVRFLYWKLGQDPGFIMEIHQWSNEHGESQSQVSETSAGQ